MARPKRKRMSRDAMKKAAVVVALTVLFVLSAAGVVAFQAVHYPDTPRGGSAEARIVVEKGISLHEIGRRLGARGIIDHPSWFRFYANERGLAQKIKAG